MQKFEFGIIVGKFSPLHKGHEALIRWALQQCRTLGILSYSKPEFPGCSDKVRRLWLEKLFPAAEVLVLPPETCPLNTDAAEIHRQFVAEHCLRTFKRIPDVVFVNDDYGPGFAEHLSRVFGKQVQLRAPDPSRGQWPVSGTMIRRDVHLHRSYLSPLVYADFVETVCFLGGESSGKSTMAEVAAAELGTAFVAEYGRTLWEEKNGQLEHDDMLRIARAHVQAEEQKRLNSNRYLFIDTSPLTTMFYSQELFGKVDPELMALADRAYDHILLCAPDFPFAQDGTRRDADFRLKQHVWYENQLRTRAIPYRVLEGSVSQRLEYLRAYLR